MSADSLTFDQFEAMIGGKIDRTSLPGKRPMELTREYLERELASIRAQKVNAANVFQQALGAEQQLMSLLAEQDKKLEPEPKDEE